jgi:hypothetical protein
LDATLQILQEEKIQMEKMAATVQELETKDVPRVKQAASLYASLTNVRWTQEGSSSSSSEKITGCIAIQFNVDLSLFVIH